MLCHINRWIFPKLFPRWNGTTSLPAGPCRFSVVKQDPAGRGTFATIPEREDQPTATAVRRSDADGLFVCRVEPVAGASSSGPRLISNELAKRLRSRTPRLSGTPYLPLFSPPSSGRVNASSDFIGNKCIFVQEFPGGNNDISAPAALGDFLPHLERTLGSVVCNARHLEDEEESRRGGGPGRGYIHMCMCAGVCVSQKCA